MPSLEDKWNRRYQNADDLTEANASHVLTGHRNLLPKNGDALDLACGLGANALLMAKQGLNVSAWDIASVAINKLSVAIEAQQLKLQPQIRDVITAPPTADSFDVIVVSQFLHRPLIPQLISALKTNGLIFYQTFTQENKGQFGPSNPGFLLQPNELLRLFTSLKILAYQEPRYVGDSANPLNGQAYIVAQQMAE